MCPQRLFTNTKLFMIAGKRNPTRARSSPDLAGGARVRSRREWSSFSDRLPKRRPCAQGAARRGAAGSARSARATAAPPLSSRRRGAPASAVLFPRRRPALFFPDLLTLTPLFSPQSGAGKKLPVPKKKKFTSGVEISDKKLLLPTTRRPQPATSVNFLLLNTYSPV